MYVKMGMYTTRHNTAQYAAKSARMSWHCTCSTLSYRQRVHLPAHGREDGKALDIHPRYMNLFMVREAQEMTHPPPHVYATQGGQYNGSCRRRTVEPQGRCFRETGAAMDGVPGCPTDPTLLLPEGLHGRPPDRLYTVTTTT